MNAAVENEEAVREQAKTELTPEAKKSILKSVSEFAVALGKGASSLIDRLRGIQDPEAALSALDAQLETNRQHRAPLQKRYEQLCGEIAAKKKVYLAAPPARKRILELELKALLAEYQGLKRQLEVCFENERIITVVRTRTLELTAMGLRKLREKDIDELTDKIEDAVGDQEDVADAMRDLEKAGKRHDADDADAFADALAGFDETAAPVAESGDVSSSSDPVAAPSDSLAGFSTSEENERKEFT